MTDLPAITIDVLIERKHPEMPVFVVVPAAAVASWNLGMTTTVEGTLDGVPIGRRSLIRWDENRWFMEFRGDLLRSLGKSAGDRATLVVTLASTQLPSELQTLIDTHPAARLCWEARTVAQRRMLREEILSAKSSATRERRARRALLPPESPRAAPRRVEGLSREGGRALMVRIVARRLPGRKCGPYTDIRVGLAQKVGCDPDDTVAADVPEVTWETRIEVSQRSDGLIAFRGRAVNGPPHERFLYVTWTGRKDGGPAAMFRRAKLRLDAIPAEALEAALGSGTLVGCIDLTASDGMPVCGSVRPPAIAWSSD